MSDKNINLCIIGVTNVMEKYYFSTALKLQNSENDNFEKDFERMDSNQGADQIDFEPMDSNEESDQMDMDSKMKPSKKAKRKGEEHLSREEFRDYLSDQFAKIIIREQSQEERPKLASYISTHVPEKDWDLILDKFILVTDADSPNRKAFRNVTLMGAAKKVASDVCKEKSLEAADFDLKEEGSSLEELTSFAQRVLNVLDGYDNDRTGE